MVILISWQVSVVSLCICRITFWHGKWSQTWKIGPERYYAGLTKYEDILMASCSLLFNRCFTRLRLAHLHYIWNGRWRYIAMKIWLGCALADSGPVIDPVAVLDKWMVPSLELQSGLMITGVITICTWTQVHDDLLEGKVPIFNFGCIKCKTVFKLSCFAGTNVKWCNYNVNFMVFVNLYARRYWLINAWRCYCCITFCFSVLDAVKLLVLSDSLQRSYNKANMERQL